MIQTQEFLTKVLDSVPDQLVVIDALGDIQFANKSWHVFGDENASTLSGDWDGVNYLSECDKASDMGDEIGTRAGQGIRSVIEAQNHEFYLEYPCHSPDVKRWFMMRVNSFDYDDRLYFVISHQDITERKLTEEKVEDLARLDGLTGIANRRYFEEFLHQEWRRCARLKKPICLAIIDIDNFKMLNDTYGHQSGDDCLISFGELLTQYARRPGDLCARYGGEEFILLWADTSLKTAKRLVNRLMRDISGLDIPNPNSPTATHVTASIGLTEMTPRPGTSHTDIVSIADDALYRAKEGGRNQIYCQTNRDIEGQAS
ncbi:sensor domain-containing diguanylate cyclase [Saccharospirillum salsuginis]|uniref:diguanylate cyclase n=1 Tax=Saccharospirillum salsuginis TaxID=418750 RepID=A0A918K746_9GAMM|nr:sensor domain-containing diguanylate cyclase [Saccharospirillum salsuginis]GGX52900.1 GGDEF domain-containing protein [Saccharospirillum salsuginis]